MKIRHPLIIRSVVRCAAAAFRLLFSTVRVKIETGSVQVCPYRPTGDDRFLYCIWHDGIVGVIFSGRCLNLAALTSRHADGEFVAQACEALGIPAVRGSSGRSGAGAVRKMMDTASDWHIAITTDGPRGPRREVKDGILFLAAMTGRAIVPVAFDADRAWRPRGKWTDMVIPKPFSNAILAGGEPIAIPANLTREDLPVYRQQMQYAMNALNADVTSRLRGSEHLEAPRDAASQSRAA